LFPKNSMKIPADSFIDPRKISHYLLRPLEESDKSEFLADAGYDLTGSQRLLDDIRTQLLPLDAENTSARSSMARNFGFAAFCRVQMAFACRWFPFGLP
jgi:hypothetical protein